VFEGRGCRREKLEERLMRSRDTRSSLQVTCISGMILVVGVEMLCTLGCPAIPTLLSEKGKVDIIKV
jgi:hypothetical protein